MTRREVLALAAAGVLRGQAPQSLKFRGLDHIEFTVADVERSVAFYAQLFGGADVMKNRTTTRRYIKLGSSYMAIDRADAPRIDHACIGIEDFDIATVHAYLTVRGLTYRDYPSGRDTGVNDPDGTRLQLSSADGWTSLAAQTASPEPRVENAPPLFQADSLTSIQVGVGDLSVASAHYGKLLGSTLGRVYRVGSASLEILSGDHGFRRFSVKTRSQVEVAEARRRLEALGVLVGFTDERGVRFIDLDGFQVEVVSPSMRIEE